jgi:transposase
MSDPQVFVGIDVSKAQLDVALRPTADRWHVSHDAAGMAPLGERWRTVQPTLVGLEATGGWEVPGTGALAAAGVPIVVVNPRHARALAKAPGRLATTDALDAQGLAHVAQAVRPSPRPLPEAQAQALRALPTRRRQVVQRLTAERRRRQRAPQRLRAAIQAHLPWLERRLARPEADLAAALRSSPRGRAKAALLQCRPGGGPVRSGTLVAEVPEWGLVNRQEIAALIGVAPFNDARGALRGKRAVWGGRAHVRAVRYRRTLAAVRPNPVLKAFYARLRAVGKAPTGARTACMRQLLTMLNAMLKHRPPWHENYADHP